VFGPPYADGTQLSTNPFIDQQVLSDLKSTGYSFLGGLNQAARICKKKLLRLWITCVYLWANLWLPSLYQKKAATACPPLKNRTTEGKSLKSRLFH